MEKEKAISFLQGLIEYIEQEEVSVENFNFYQKSIGISKKPLEDVGDFSTGEVDVVLSLYDTNKNQLKDIFRNKEDDSDE